jgi:hypothetical protein
MRVAVAANCVKLEIDMDRIGAKFADLLSDIEAIKSNQFRQRCH